MTPDQEAIITESHVVERDDNHLTEQEQTMLKELLRPGASIEASIPEGASAEELWHTLKACTRGLNVLESRALKLRPIIGRILLLFERKPSLYRSLGFETYSEFINKGAYETLGVHHTAAYQGKNIAEKWPQVTPDEYAQLGPKRMEILNKVTQGSSPNAKEWLDRAKVMKVQDLKAYCEQRGALNPGEVDGATLTITTNRDKYALFKAFFGDGRVQSVVGSKSPDDILVAAIQACHNEWIAQFEESRRRKKSDALENRNGHAPVLG